MGTMVKGEKMRDAPQLLAAFVGFCGNPNTCGVSVSGIAHYRASRASSLPFALALMVARSSLAVQHLKEEKMLSLPPASKNCLAPWNSTDTDFSYYPWSLLSFLRVFFLMFRGLHVCPQCYAMWGHREVLRSVGGTPVRRVP
ncbi:hypothetical protein TraAM80_03275 [Trypanosoma rangeli]|uniref:Uncharacterized protein n=1 Tax=Trypanosoma rangeli TaxID=5698 RepID=A0A422NQ43_TRYRA|nr:uncharacterized protein TraAM80_03275 [Trypanosoma rangeli]RNF07592.1 hypothetical protein TraAM80_03275 [Trypanosoma rangeli]|eukprot:RNF07592.1 hypothetical protein TraAM80_03275 [Trypanosoma rangeli]